MTHWNVIGSPVHVKRIIMNIMSNAVKYNKDYGKIDLICKEIPTDENGTALFQFICHDTGNKNLGRWNLNKKFRY